MKIISRIEAKKSGLSRFFTGVPCVHGHISIRRTINRSCVTCESRASKTRNARKQAEDPEYVINNRRRVNDWRLANLARHAEANKLWAINNREHRAAKDKAYREINRERIKSRKAAKFVADPDIYRRRYEQRMLDPVYRKSAVDRARRWTEADPERARITTAAAFANYRARHRAAGKISPDDILEVRAPGICAACGISKGKMQVDHIISLAKGGSNSRSNLQLLCRSCNSSKSDSDFKEWLAKRLLRLSND